MNTAAIRAAVRARFCSPEWATFFEVGDATGGRHRRWADAVAMNLYPSRGLSIDGFEFKISRSDWQRELKDPTKSAPVQQYCNHWWVITTPDIVREGELPPTWGLMELQANGSLRQKVAAPALQPIPVTKEFVAAMLRRASEVDEGEVKAAVDKEVQRLRAADKEQIEREVKWRTRDWESVAKKVAEIKEHSGIDLLHGFDCPKEIGNALRLVLSADVMQGGYGGGMHGLLNQLKLAHERISKALEVFEAPSAEKQDAA